MPRTEVLIAGGSLSGLSASIFLGQLGIGHVLVERHRGTAVHPRITGLTARSMELFDAVGIGDRIRANGRTGSDIGEVVKARTPTAETLTEAASLPGFGGPQYESLMPAHISPTGMCACDQDVLEPLMRDHAEHLGADLRFGVELVDFEQSADQVTATVRDRTSGARETITARYLIAADGPRSGVRTHLGVQTHGPGLIGHGLSLVFRADLQPALGDRSVYVVTDRFGTFVRRGGGRWQLVVPYDPKAQALAEFTHERCREMIRAATGLDDLEAEIRSVMPVEIRAEISDQFEAGRVYLIGDAAHPAPPSQGLGGNLGVQDAHNLAWKLDAVLRGSAGPGLLETYDAERRPIAQITIACQLADIAPGHPDAYAWDYPTVVFGHHYTSAAVTRQDTDDHHPVEDPRTPTAEPGTRAPHIVLQQAGRTLSTIDLTGNGFVLLAGPEGRRWPKAVAKTAAELGVHIDTYLLGDNLLDIGNGWSTTYHAEPTDAVLIRPDGIIGWHSRTGGRTPDDLANALHRILSRSTAHQ